MRVVYCTGEAYAVAAQQFHTERCCCIADLYIIVHCKLTLLRYFTVNPVHYGCYCTEDLYTTLLLHRRSIHYAVTAQWIYTLLSSCTWWSIHYAIIAQWIYTLRCYCTVELYTTLFLHLVIYTLRHYWTVDLYTTLFLHFVIYTLRHYCTVDLYTTLLLHSPSVHYTVTAQWTYTLRCYCILDL